MKQDSVTLRDEELRKRLDGIVKSCNGRVSKSAIIRAAMDELLTRIETKGIASLLSPPPADSAPPFPAQPEMEKAMDKSIKGKGGKSPHPPKGPSSPSAHK